MGRPCALLAGLLLALLAGCVTDQAAPGLLDARRPGFARVPADTVLMKVAVIERRLGDPYLNREIWSFTDEQAVDLERKAILEDNGFRVGQVVGMLPSGLQALLASDRACANRTLYLKGPGKPTTLELGPSVPECRLTVVHQGESAEVRLNEAQFMLRVMPIVSPDGHTRLHFTPQVRYGESLRDFRVAPDGSGYLMQIERPSRKFDDLSWDVDLTPNQYVLVGGKLDQPDRLGYACFVQSEAAGAVQRLLVLWTNRAMDTPEPIASHATQGRVTPLALQATQP